MKVQTSLQSLSRRMALLTVSTLLLGQLVPTHAAKGGKPPPPPPPPADSGTVDFNNDTGSGLQIWSMKPDGTAKTSLPVLDAGGAEPSRVLHGGRRWFLTQQDVPGEFYPPDPNGNQFPRQEVFAVNDQGVWLQLTDDPAIEAWAVRWTSGPAGTDGRITVVAHRWVQDAGGNWMSIDPGLYYVDVEPDTWASAPPQPQSPQRIETIDLPVAEDEVGFYANISGYDWSPDGTHVVYSTTDGLYVVQADDGATGQLLAVTGTHSPRWSPIQASGHTQILFGVGQGHAGRIDRVNDDGTVWITAVPIGSSSNIWTIGASARWSPAGTHFVYQEWTMDKKVFYRIKTSHVWRAAADGSGKTDLTTQMTFCYTLGWVDL